jgi:hypothetical protein
MIREGRHRVDSIKHFDGETFMRNDAEPPSGLQAPCFMIGQDSHGNWVVRDGNGIRGGLFVDRAQAVKFVRFETGNQPNAIVVASGILELDMGGRPTLPVAAHAAYNASSERRAA